MLEPGIRKPNARKTVYHKILPIKCGHIRAHICTSPCEQRQRAIMHSQALVEQYKKQTKGTVFTCWGEMTGINLKNGDRGNIATGETNQIRSSTPCVHLVFRLGGVTIFKIARSLLILIAASVVMITMPLTLMKYMIKWHAAEPRFHVLVHLTTMTKGTVLTNKRSARKRLMVKLVLFASHFNNRPRFTWIFLRTPPLCIYTVSDWV